MMDIRRFTTYLSKLSWSVEYNTRIQIQRFHIRAQSAFTSFQDMPLYPLNFNDVPPLFCEPFILSGFRSIHQPWSYYCQSLFRKHNETINVWSHLIGIVYMIYLFCYLNTKLNFYENAHSWPFVIALCTTIAMFACSTFAHLFHSKSESVHMTCFLIDFVGISLYGVGAGFLQIYYSAPEWYYEMVEYQYVAFLFVFGILACYLNCFAQYYFHRPYPPLKRICQFFPCGVLWIYEIIPLCIRLYSSNIFSSPALICHFIQISLFPIGATVFGFDLPQRFYPGVFDFFGQGHHLFHFIIYLICVCQFHGVYWDYEEFQNIIDQRSKPELISCAGSILSLLVLDFVIVLCFRRKIHEKYHFHRN